MRKIKEFKMSNLHVQRGFTLIELIIVTAILGILTAIVIASLDPPAQYAKTQDGRRKSDLSQIQRALESYYQDHNYYPDSTANYQISGAAWGSSGLAPYMTKVPIDANPTKTYAYKSSGHNGQSYWIYVSLDRGGKDPQACNSGNLCANATGISCDRSGSLANNICNYGVSSPDQSP